ncbi:YheC/D like ATP-grasp [Evansella caseinilytica]|uniref:YheC/D like ATP-grasp n=1 Tax=Evansella caseinilytica TaxID=1503961 RepID=A0A1H3JYY7_9BACI|nr:YheC/YheD family protein [Evansella caseinilytica]SDY45153.1 YheC/D like ATP-grasp [Evansella caseinilytica]
MTQQHGKKIMIVTAPANGKRFCGETNYYEQLLTAVANSGGKGYVFPLDKNPMDRKGFYWDAPNRRWVAAFCPIPDIVYNRYPFKIRENKLACKRFFQWLDDQHIPCFNTAFFDKLTIATLLKNDAVLSAHAPLTEQLRSLEQLRRRLKKYPVVFLKDIHGAQGRGIWKVVRKGKSYQLHSQRKVFPSLTFPALSCLLQPVIKQRTLLIQQGIRSLKTADGVYDFRVLMMKEKKHWQCIGTGIRLAAHGGFTTHVKYGGKAASTNAALLRPPQAVVAFIGRHVGRLLDASYPHIREFSMDMVMDRNRQLWIVDINSKPMSFDENIIQQKRIRKLVNIFLKQGV